MKSSSNCLVTFNQLNLTKKVSQCKTYIKFTLIDGTIIFANSGSALHLQIIETETSVFVTSSRVAIRICNVMSIH